MYHTEPPTDKTIREWCMKFQQSGCLCAAKRTGRPGPSAETVERVREAFVRSPQKSTTHASRELQMSQSSVWRVKGFRLQLLQALNPQDHNLRLRFSLDFQQLLLEDHLDVRAHLNAILPGRWIGRASHNDSPILPWRPRSPDLTPCDFFLWVYIKDRVYVPPMPRNLPQLR